MLRLNPASSGDRRGFNYAIVELPALIPLQLFAVLVISFPSICDNHHGVSLVQRAEDAGTMSVSRMGGVLKALGDCGERLATKLDFDTRIL